MVTAVLLTVVLGAILALSESAQRAVPRDEALAFSIERRRWRWTA